MLLRFGLLAGLCLVLVLCEEEEIIKCPGGTCVKLHLCPNGELNTDGANIIDIRFNPDNECEDYLLKCCPDPEEDEDDVDEPPTSRPIVQPDSVTKPSSGNDADPVPGTVPSLPSSTPHGTGGTGNTAGPKPSPGSIGGVVGGGGGGGGAGGGGVVGNVVGGNKGNQGVNDEQVQMVGGEILPNQGQIAANQIKETDVPYPQGGGPPVPGAGASGGVGTATKKPGGDIPPTGLGLNPTGQTNVPSGAGSATGTGPEGASVKKPGQPGTGSGTTGSSPPSATGPEGAGAKQPGQPGTGSGTTGSSSPSATGPGGAGAKQPGQQGTGPESTGSPSPSATGPGGAGAKQPGQQGTGPQSTGSPSPSATGPGGAGAKQPGQPGTGSVTNGSLSPSATGPGGAGAKQPDQPGTVPGSTGSPSPAATGPGGAGAKQPGQQGTGPQSTGSPSPSATGPGGAGAIGGSNVGQPKPGKPAVPSTNAGGGLPSSGASKHPNVADTKHTHPTNGDGTNKKGQLITTERPINVPQKCGVRNVDGVGFRITGDNDGESEYGEFPWMVAILKEEKALDQVINVYQCGGSLIHPSVVLTAAHCVQNRQPTEMKVRLGEWDTQTKNEIYDYQDRDVVEIVSHAEFYKGGLFNDVALLFLDKPAELMDTVSTICLPPADYNFDLSRCFASGWGKDVFGKQGTYQVILKKIELPIMARDKCQKALRTTRLGNRFKLHKSFICAGGEKNRDTCKGDGGSPLVCPIPGTVNQYYQAGMVAWGIGCGEDGIPGVYVNVPMFRGWIDEHLTQRNIPHSYYLPA
uniref:Phenoloxidase-activating factor 2 n=1 Tax=Anopheles atroparvus TaxID=41427 RepID=A0AAG5DH04_ANOAO